MSPPGKEKPLLGGKGLRKRIKTAYRLLLLLQARQSLARRCVCCNCRVTNRNLGGCSGRTALTGPVWCLECADFPRQLLFNFGGVEQ